MQYDIKSLRRSQFIREGKMQIDWQRAINDILSNKISCPRCGAMEEEMLIGYMRTPEAVEWAPLCEGCSRRNGCDTRKLVVLCQGCATSVRLPGPAG